MTWQRPAPGVMPLAGGELRFQGDKELKDIRTIQIADGAGSVTRAWSGFGDALTWPGLTLSSPGQLFIMRVDANTFRVYGEKVKVRASASVSASLPDFPRHELTKRVEGDAVIIEPHGWQRGQWFELRLG